MAAKKSRPFQCEVVHEVVQISLKNRRVGGFSGDLQPFVQCDQAECQYVDTNLPPCPLDLSLFEDELKELEARRRQRQEAGSGSDDDY